MTVRHSQHCFHISRIMPEAPRSEPSPKLRKSSSTGVLLAVPQRANARAASGPEPACDPGQYQLGFLGFGGHTGFAGTKLSRFGILTFGRVVASMTSVS